MTQQQEQLLDLPSSNSSCKYEQLAYVDAYDAVLNCDYAFLAYKETDTDASPGNQWRVRIRSSQTAGAVFEPAMMKNQARQANAQGKPWFQWGYSFDPSAGDPRTIQFRVHHRDGQTSEIEMFICLRKADGTPADAKSVRFPWPA